jgi:TonB family protein
VRAHIQGAVIVDFEVAADGRVISTSVVKPLPFGLTVAAEKAIREWIAPPEILKSHAAPLKGTAKFTFTLFPDDDGPGGEVPSRPFTTSDKGS